jgi:hypothetical protein
MSRDAAVKATCGDRATGHALRQASANYEGCSVKIPAPPGNRRGGRTVTIMSRSVIDREIIRLRFRIERFSEFPGKRGKIFAICPVFWLNY